MSNIWYVIIVGLLAVVVLLLILRRNSATSQATHPGGRGHARNERRDYGREREDARVAHMSEDDRAWEAAALQRHHENQERDAGIGSSRL